MSAIIAGEAGRTFVPFRFGGSADNILYAGTEEQKQEYLIPTIEGRAPSSRSRPPSPGPAPMPAPSGPRRSVTATTG